MSNYSVERFLSILPEAITQDAHLMELAEVAARVFKKVYDNRKSAAIYSRIDSLPESLLDILARDLKVDWYDFNATLATKRRTIRDSWYIHKRLGTADAVKRAISDVWPDSSLEEWFEYSGDPYHFRVILDASENVNPIQLDEVMKKVRLFKPARAVMDQGEPIIKVTFGIVINTDSQSRIYHVPRTGTLPRWSTHGSYEEDGLLVGTSAPSAVYSVPRCGEPSGAL